MRKTIAIVLFMFAAGSASAQQYTVGTDSTSPVALKAVQVRARFKNDTERYHFNQMRYYVTTILPYLDAATKLFHEIDAKEHEPNLTRKEWRTFIHEKDEQMRGEFEDKVRDLNVTQGALLIKLIARQTNINIYEMLSSFKSPLAAVKWQTWARLHGMNLDRKYQPEEEPDLELIMEGLGYPLPASYAVNNP